MAYTYIIGWSEHKKYYYGVRHSKKSNPEELWKTYFTSSKHVEEFARVNGDPDVIQIRRTFVDSDSAIEWEHKVLRRMKVNLREDFINKSYNKCISMKDSIKGSNNSCNKKRGESLKQFYDDADPEYVIQIKENRINGIHNMSKEMKKKQSEGISKGQVKSWSDPETKKRRSESMRKPKRKIQSPQCGKIGGANIMPRFHFDNCKSIIGE